MQKLSTKQVNNLMTGNDLAMEIDTELSEVRAFVVIRAYNQNGQLGGAPVSKYLNNMDKSEIRFLLRRYEIKKEYVESDYDISDDELVNSVFIKNIESIDQLEFELSKYLDDFSGIDVGWKCDNPI